MSGYVTICDNCKCPIHMEDDFDEADDARCEECRIESGQLEASK